MQKKDGLILYSASDITNFLVCEHLTALDRIDLETPLPRAEDDEEALLFQSKGIAHERAYLEHLKLHSASLIDIASEENEVDIAVQKTIEAMRSGVEIIYQAALADGPFIGHADFLRRVSTPSALGNYSYEVIDTKLSRSAKAKYIVQLCFYSELVASIQQLDPVMMHLFFGNRQEQGFRYADYSRYYRSLKARFLANMEDTASETYPELCEHCDFCRWRNLCKQRWLEDDHLNQVAGIARSQIRKLRECGVDTLAKLADLSKERVIPGMAPETLARLQQQAALQLKGRNTGKNHYECLPIDPERKRGFARLPKPDQGDIFFDMEGDVFEIGGLEYLFGVYCFQGGKPVYRPIWAHTRSEEKAAFEQFMDFVTKRLRKYPGAHIYHYAAYEETALKRLMSLHGVREAEVDNLLRLGKMVDLYRVVREALRISEPRYSLKNVERFYLEERVGEVKDAAASLIYYEKFKETGNNQYLQKIADYNYDDVRSTHQLRQWLLSLRPPDLPWAAPAEKDGSEASDITALNDIEQRLLEYRELLLDNLPENRDVWTPEHGLKELTFQLLDFHRRADKPVWWALFSRRDMSHEELIEDVEAIGAMTQHSVNQSLSDTQSLSYTYRYPQQETKLKTGDRCVVADTLDSVSNVKIDEDERTVILSYPLKKGHLPDVLSIGLGGPVDADALREAVFRFADSVIAGNARYRALERMLKQEPPSIRGRRLGRAIIDESREALPQIIEAVSRLDDSYLFIQGPPGTGKTYAGSHIIVELLRRGRRIGVSSNSHKAINNLLAAIEKAAKQKGVKFRGVKKSNHNDDSAYNGEFIYDVFRNEHVEEESWQLVGGTAWLFSRPTLDQSFDFLFVDEAGQVALANLIAMGVSARNIVLIGDQMQLSQPIQGVHPGRSGESSLDYLLEGVATIPPERGIFLNTTWRMHGDICKFISEAVYDCRLKPHEPNNRQRLILGRDAHPALQPSGIRFVPVDHTDCFQRSQEEADLIREIYTSLLKQHYQDKDGRKHPITAKNILVVAPYNMQVNLLKRTLPSEARVGTVDKFQGQEAEVVIVSMTTSDGDCLPHRIEFLYSKNRLNVALSRAKCLAILVANPELMSIRCNTPEQMALVNTLCWVKEYSDAQREGSFAAAMKTKQKATRRKRHQSPGSGQSSLNRLA